jgi:hypothetical protein
MPRPCYFVVAQWLGREVPQLFWDELPREPVRNMIYVMRLDQHPDAERLCATDVAQLYDTFCHLRHAGKLPPRWEPPKRPSAEPAKVRTGHREVHPRRHLPDLPYEAI